MFSHLLELIFIDPRLPALGDPDPSLLKLDVPREFFEWLRIKGETVEQQYVEGLPETLEYIQKKVQDVFLEYGRFDGFLGYSQGASCALIMSLSYASVSVYTGCLALQITKQLFASI